VDGALLPTGEKKFRGVGIYVKLIVGGNDFESVVDDVLMEDGGPGLFVGVAEPTKSRVDAWHWAARCWGLCLLAVLIFQD